MLVSPNRRLLRRGPAFFSLAAVAFITACRGEPPAPPAFPPVEVGVVDVEPRALALVLEYPAQLKGVREVEVRARVSGILLERRYDEGAHVEAGEILFRIDADPYRIALQSAQANLAVAMQNEDASQADVRVADAQLKFQREDLAASQQLGKIVLDLAQKRALSETSAIRARADIDKTRASVTKAEAEAARARIRLGEGPDGNPQVRQALAALEQAFAKLGLQA